MVAPLPRPLGDSGRDVGDNQEEEEEEEDNEEGEDYEEGEGEEGEEGEGGEGEPSLSVVLDMEGDIIGGSKGTTGTGGPRRRRQRHKKANKTRSLVDIIPTLMSEEAEQGLEFLAHAVAADAREAEAEAAEAHAAATGDEGNDSEKPRQSMPTRQSVADMQRAASAAGGLEQQANIMSMTGTVGGLGGEQPAQAPKFYPKDHPHHGHSAPSRKGVLIAKQQCVRTLTLPKEGETVEMELAVKDLLRYIQKAVRDVHISQQQQQSISQSQAPSQFMQKESSAVLSSLAAAGSAPLGRRGTMHSRTMSNGNIINNLNNGPSRILPPAPVGGLLNARDVRRLISGLDTESVKNKEMSIAVRRHTIVLNLDIIRCLILWDRLIVVVPEGADSNCFGNLEENLRWLRVQQRAFDMDEDSRGTFVRVYICMCDCICASVFLLIFSYFFFLLCYTCYTQTRRKSLSSWRWKPC